jgi:hypothetical protein
LRYLTQFGRNWAASASHEKPGPPSNPRFVHLFLHFLDPPPEDARSILSISVSWKAQKCIHNVIWGRGTTLKQYQIQAPLSSSPSSGPLFDPHYDHFVSRVFGPPPTKLDPFQASIRLGYLKYGFMVKFGERFFTNKENSIGEFPEFPLHDQCLQMSSYLRPLLAQ